MKKLEEKLLEKGYKVWVSGKHIRIYINDFKKYLDIKEKGICRRSAVKVYEINGISNENCNKWIQKAVVELAESNKLSIYYDCVTEKFYFKDEYNCKLICNIYNSGINKLREDFR